MTEVKFSSKFTHLSQNIMSEIQANNEVQPWLGDIVALARPLSEDEITKVIEYIKTLDSGDEISQQLLGLDNIFQLSRNTRARINEIGIELEPVSDQEERESIEAAVFEALSPFLEKAILAALSKVEANERVSKLPQVAIEIRSLRCSLQTTLENKVELDSETIQVLVQSCMKLFGLSQKVVAEQSGLAQGSISNLLKGQKQSNKTYEKLSNWLESQKGKLREKLTQAGATLEATERSIVEKYVG